MGTIDRKIDEENAIFEAMAPAGGSDFAKLCHAADPELLVRRGAAW